MAAGDHAGTPTSWELQLHADISVHVRADHGDAAGSRLLGVAIDSDRIAAAGYYRAGERDLAVERVGADYRGLARVCFSRDFWRAIRITADVLAAIDDRRLLDT